MDESLPATLPDGSLVPPPGGPPTALATAAPLPPQPNRGTTARPTLLAAIVERTFKQLDSLADGIARMIGVR